MKEIWKDIPGYEGLYQVSNLGGVKSLSDRWGRERILKQCMHSTGRYYLNLTKDGKLNSFKIHQLVAMAFLDHKPDGKLNIVVNHIDNNPLNNHVDNLELVSNRYNSSCHKTDVGISWDKTRDKWRTGIQINRKDITIGRYTDKQDALDAYQKALANIHLYDGDNKAFRALIHQLDV